MNYAQFLALLLAAKEHLPTLLSALERLYQAVQDVGTVLNLIYRAGHPVAMAPHVERAVSTLELNHEEQILAMLPQAYSAPGGVAAPAWDGSRLRRLFDAVQKFLPLFKLIVGVSASAGS